mmetsp:Transcript_36049/g.54349  ORF Transcript_36049/g.54349 Transcript_36049/m.54349 type:complete len:409 (+) Transcript_36049:104-1330(+)|eukprot:CAMPEP_0194746704 /NCGR_PEP_ID=MMETSP0323_2-20130528/676_1 /TAXON_ID=2866 ORGANISM="Crypthecodinium cohnii, Strain Seligo" /NCGR_SAMPLE_ID=MMETSP0323_2 /ASSEMBLY_ACC=CAM_ASM_000346 /LENGTH=408 /DNA_ID=CAMNT_0039659381 /DNA_START=11 /DNA_END=1237 /DNA_ORIENTATION=-
MAFSAPPSADMYKGAPPGADGMYGAPPPGGRNSEPCDNLYMRGLPGGSTEQSIKDLFTPYGNVISVKVLAPAPGKPDTAALVRMSTLDEAKWLVENLNGNIPQGLAEPINVRYAEGRRAKGAEKGAWGAPAGGDWGWGAPQHHAPAGAAPWGSESAPNTNLYMKGLPNETTEGLLRSIFQPYGEVTSIKVLPSAQGGINSTAALVQMGSLTEATWLVENVNNNIPEGLHSPIQIKYANSQKGNGKGGAPPAGGDQWGAWGGAQSWGGGKGGALPPVPPPAAGGGKGFGPPQGAPSDNLYMKGFPAEFDESSVRAVMGPYGNIVSVKILPPPPGKAFAAALVRLSTLDEAKWLVDNLNGNIPEGMSHPLEVKYAANGSGGGKGFEKGGWEKGGYGAGYGEKGGARYAPY